MNTVNIPAKFEVHFWDTGNSDWSFGWGCEPQSSGREGHRGSEMEPFKRALVSSYRHSIVTFPLSLHISQILTFFCSSTTLFPTPMSDSPLVSSNFLHVPLGVGGWPLGYEERRCWTYCPRLPTYIVLIHQRHRRMDTRMTCNHKTALCSIVSIVHCTVKQRQNTSIPDIISIADNVSWKYRSLID